jgi:hypothetical protein
MVFLAEADLHAFILEEHLDTLTEGVATALDDTERIAIEEASTYLRHRYNVAAAFGATGSDRNSQLIRILSDITLYHLFTRVQPDEIPELRVKRYDDAISTLNRISKGQISPNLPALSPAQGSPIRWGSQPKQDHYL